MIIILIYINFLEPSFDQKWAPFTSSSNQSWKSDFTNWYAARKDQFFKEWKDHYNEKIQTEVASSKDVITSK